MKKLVFLTGILLSALLAFFSVPLWQNPVAAQEPAYSSKVSSLLAMQVKDKSQYLARGGKMPAAEVVSPELVGRPLEEVSRQKVFIHFKERPNAIHLAELQALGVTAYPDSWIPPVGRHPSGFLYAEMPVGSVYDVADKSYVTSIGTAEVTSEPHNNLADQATGVNTVWGLGYTGSDVTVAVLDSGLDLNHADIPTPVARKDYSAWPTLDDTIANTVSGHGTHVAGTALGRGTLSSGTYKGSAPGASLVFLKIGSDATSSAPIVAEVNAIKAAVDTYGARVITMSYGGWSDYHDGSGETCQAVDYAVSRGATYFGSAGNNGAADQHYSGTVNAGTTTDWIAVNVTNAGTSNTVLAFNMVWFDGIGVHNDLVLEYYDPSHISISTSGTPTQSESTRGTEGEYSRMNGYVAASSNTYYLKVRNNSGNSQFFHLYYRSSYNLSGAGTVKFATPDPFYTIGAPAEADSAITVGAYVTRNEFWDYRGNHPSSSETLNSIASFSSRGPRVDAGAPGKPNIVAPGSLLISARDNVVYPANVSPPPSYDILIVDNDGLNLNGSGPADYFVMQGTSMATPHAAGIAALLLSKNPNLTPAQIKSYLENNATDKGLAGRDNTYGWGLVNALAAINAVPPPVTAPPVASFTRILSPPNGVTPCTVNFTDTSTQFPQAWSWNFGDGTGSSSQNPTKTYNTGGNYTITLTASNFYGSSSASQAISIYSVPAASFTESASSGIAPLTINFTDTSTGNIVSWSWNFGDGTGSSSQNPSKTYASYGTRTVTLTVTNPAGSSAATAVKNIYQTPVASFTESATSVILGTPITFTDTSTGNPQSWTWNFGDGTSSSSQNPTRAYTAAGNYTVSLTVANMAGTSAPATAVKHVYATPVASFTESASSGIAPLTINFTDTSTGNIQSWSWNFGDGTGSSSQNPTKTYAAAGNYTVSLVAANMAGTSAPATAVKHVYATPVASFTESATSVVLGTPITFTDTSTGNIQTWSWNFGDGTGSSSQNPTRTYAAAGNYTVSLVVANMAGTSAPATAVKHVYATPVASFTSFPRGASPGVPIAFTDTSTGNVTGWSWNFGDGTGSSSQNPSKAYTSTGNYTIILTATNPAGSNTHTEPGFIIIATDGVSLQAQTSLIPDLDSSSYAIVHARINQLKNAANGLPFVIADGFASYSAYVTYVTAGITVIGVAGIAPFSSPTVTLNTPITPPPSPPLDDTKTDFSASQTGSVPVPPMTLADIRLRLLGSKDTARTVTLNFNTITRVSGGSITQEAAATATFKRGDAQADGTVKITDALFIAQYLAGIRGIGQDPANQIHPVNAASVKQDTDPPSVADKITITDALLIAQMLAGLRDASYNLIT